MVKAGVSHDISITDNNGVETGFMLARDGNAPVWRRRRAPIVPPAERRGLSQAALNPQSTDLTWEPESFDRGFGLFRWSPFGPLDDNYRYGYGERVAADIQGELSLGPLHQEFDVLLRNQGAEYGDTTGWTTAGTLSSLTAVTTTPQSGRYAFRCAFNGTGVGSFYQDMANVNVWKSQQVTFACGVRKVSGTGTTTISLRINDGVTITSAQAAVNTSGYTILPVTKTMSASATQVRVSVEKDNGVAADTVILVDDIVVTSDGFGIIKTAIFDGDFYAVAPRVVYRMDANRVFHAIYMKSTATLTEIVAYKTNLLVGNNNGAYLYSSAPNTSPPNFTVSLIGGNSQAAKRAVRVRDILWRLDGNNVKFTTDPTNTGSAGTAINIGDAQSTFTGIYSYQDIPIIGKTNGLWVYDRETSEFLELPFDTHSENNFSLGVTHRGWFYTTSADAALLRFNGESFEDLSFLFKAPYFGEFSSRLLGMYSYGNKLFLLMQGDFSNSWLFTLEEFIIDGTPHWVAHTITSLGLTGDKVSLSVYNDCLYLAGGYYRSGSLAGGGNFIQLPLEENARTFDGYLITPWFDGGYPDVVKAFRQLDLRLENLTASESVRVDIQVDEDTAWTTLTTYTSSGAKTLSIETLASSKRSGKRCRFRFYLEAGDPSALPFTATTATPRIKLPFVLHTTLMPQRDSEIEFRAQVAVSQGLLNGGFETASVADKLAALNGYIDSASFPVTLSEDFDRDGTVREYRVVVTDVEETENYEDDARGHVWDYTVRCVEVPV